MNRQVSLETKPLPAVTIDPTYNLIRIHKITLQLLNNPKYIALLVNPDTKCLAICEGNDKDPLSHRVDYKKLDFGKCYELYSTPLVNRLLSFIENKDNGRILLYGNYMEDFNISLFQLSKDSFGKDVS